MILHRKIDNIRLEVFFSFVDLDTGSIYIYIYSLVECLGLYVDKSVGCFFFFVVEGRLRFLLRSFDTIVFCTICLEQRKSIERRILVSNFIFVFLSSTV